MSGMTRDQAEAMANTLKAELAKVIVGQNLVVEEILIALAANGHALLEGVPGLAKTLLISTLAATTRLSFSRIQFTPDLMPADITGTEVIREDKSSGTREFQFLPGPIFASVVLADEINRTPPKTQAAMLEAMQERQVSAGGKRRELPSPFFVLATQNPIEQEGTYPLPEAQLDRFLLKITVGYPNEEDEIEVVRRTTGNVKSAPDAVMDAESLIQLQHLVRDTPVAEAILRYAISIVRATRPVSEGGHADLAPLLRWGAGPRAGQALILCAKAYATMRGHTFVSLDDVRRVVKPVLRHRIQPSYEAEAQGLSADAIVDKLLTSIELPATELERDPAVAEAI